MAKNTTDSPDTVCLPVNMPEEVQQNTWEIEAKEWKERYEKFQEKLIEKLNPLKPPPDISNEAWIFSEIDHIIEENTLYIEKNKILEKKYRDLEESKKEEIEKLKSEIAQILQYCEKLQVRIAAIEKVRKQNIPLLEAIKNMIPKGNT